MTESLRRSKIFLATWGRWREGKDLGWEPETLGTSSGLISRGFVTLNKLLSLFDHVSLFENEILFWPLASPTRPESINTSAFIKVIMRMKECGSSFQVFPFSES